MLLASTFVGGGLGTAVMIMGLTHPDSMGWLIGVSAPVLLAYAWAWVRIWRVGVVIRESEVTVTSWFAVRRFSRESVERWSVGPYTGAFYVLGWPIAAGRLEPGVLTVDLVNGGRQQVSGTATMRTTARAQARCLNEWLQLNGARAVVEPE